MILFSSISLAFVKSEISADFLSEYCPSQFSQVIVLFDHREKSQNEKLLEFFQLFAFFCSASLIDTCHKMARN